MSPVNPEILAAINAGISAEISSYVFYVEASKRLENSEIKEMLEKLAAEEKEHFQILEKQHHSLLTSEKWISIADILKEPGLPQIDEDMGSKHQAIIDQVRNANNTAEVLKIAYRFEVEAFELFSAQVGKTDSEEARQMYQTLAKFEKGHMTMIQGMIDGLK